MTMLRAGSATDTGLVRHTNQDQLLIDPHLYAVADGMGGHAGGDVASLTAVEALRQAFGDPDEDGHTADDLRNAVRWANRTVHQRSMEQSDLHGMGTTLTAAALVTADHEERIAVANVGDSRAYVFAKGELTQLTEDHTVAEELVRQGQLEPDDVANHPQRHILTRALGIQPDVEVDLWEVLPFAGDRIVLCSDGLCRELSDEQIASVLRRFTDPTDAAKELVSRARASGGADNITVVVIDVVDDDDRAHAASAALADESAAETSLGHDNALSEGEDAPAVSSRSLAVSSGSPTASAGEEPPDIGSVPRKRRLTLMVVAFLLVCGLVLGAAATAVVYYGRETYFVGLEGRAGQPQVLVVYRGRPGGLLWFKPTIETRTQVTTARVLPSRLPDLQHGKIEATAAEARAYIDRLVREATTPATSATASTLPPLPPPPVGITTVP
jgi:serine/threonine protein phosphatase PrpC